MNERSYQGAFANTSAGETRLLAWLAKQTNDQIHACLEATGTYGDAVALVLTDAGHLVSIVNPVRIVAYARSKLCRNKTDRVDAALIARFCQKEQPALWTPPSPEVRELRALVRHVHALQQERQAEANRLGVGTYPAAVTAAMEAHLQFLAVQIASLEAIGSVACGWAIRTSSADMSVSGAEVDADRTRSLGRVGTTPS